MGFEPMTFKTKCVESTNEPQCPILVALPCVRHCICALSDDSVLVDGIVRLLQIEYIGVVNNFCSFSEHIQSYGQ